MPNDKELRQMQTFGWRIATDIAIVILFVPVVLCGAMCGCFAAAKDIYRKYYA